MRKKIFTIIIILFFLFDINKSHAYDSKEKTIQYNDTPLDCCMGDDVDDCEDEYVNNEIEAACEDNYIDEDIKNTFGTETVETSAKESSINNINSRIAVVYDRESGRVVWGKNENKKTAMASTTKIMTAIVVIENSNLNDTVEISKKSANTGGSRLGLKTGDKISVNDLLYGLMLRSGNDAAVALAEHVGGSVENFANLMNEKAQSLSLKETHFVTPHGLDNPEHYTTAFELSKIADYSLKNQKFLEIVSTKTCTITINGYPKTLNNTNELLGNFAGVYGVKTGFTNNAGRCLVTAIKKDDIDIITVVIQADTKKDRTKDSVKIINYILKNYKKIDVEEYVENAFYDWCKINQNNIRIEKAKSEKIQIHMDKVTNKKILVKQDEADNIDVKISAIFDYKAPVAKNKKIGEVKIFINNDLLELKDIHFSNEIEEKTLWDYVKKCAEAMF